MKVKLIVATKKKCQLVSEGLMPLEEFNRSVSSFCGTLMHCDSFGLRRKLNSIYDQFAYSEKYEDVCVAARKDYDESN